MSSSRKALPTGTQLDCYRLIRLIGSGGFSLIYLAQDEDSHDEVAIKEYFPKRFGVRQTDRSVGVDDDKKTESFHRGRKLFYQEAKALAMLKHPNIVSVRNCFLANHTAYLVMDYEPGKNLGTYIKRRKGGLSTNFMMTVFPPLLDALGQIHSLHHVHLDIKPGNIHLRPGGNPLLLDFGAVHLFSDRDEPVRKKSQIITPGFSPVEQYYTNGQVGPWSDVYAVGATMRACLEGKPPPPATQRHANDELEPAVETFRDRYPRWLLEAIDWSMDVDPLLRPQSADELRNALTKQTGRPAVRPVPKPADKN